MKKLFLILIFVLISTMAHAETFSKVKYISNYDGDTIKFDLGKGKDIFNKDMSVRVYGIDTPEIKGKTKCEKSKSQEAKEFVADKLGNAKRIKLKNCTKGKYFRLVCNVEYDGKDLTKELLKHNYGYEYFGKTKKSLDWCK